MALLVREIHRGSALRHGLLGLGLTLLLGSGAGTGLQPSRSHAGVDDNPRRDERGIALRQRVAALTLELAAVMRCGELPPPMVISSDDAQLAAILESNASSFACAASPCGNRGGRVGRGVLAVYSIQDGRIHLAVNIAAKTRRLARAYGVAIEPAALFDVIMLHELTHYAQDNRFGIRTLARQAHSYELSSALRAVLEGHAQFVTRKLCATKARQAAFDLCCLMNRELPSALSAARGHRAMRLILSELGFAYDSGLRFFETLEERLGQDPTARVFNALPRSTRQILRPAEYLRGQADPGVELERIFCGFARGELPSKMYENCVTNLTEPTLRASFALLGEGRAGRLMANFVASRVLRSRRRDGRGELIIVLVRMKDAASAQGLLRAEVAVSRQREDIRRAGADPIPASKGVSPGKDGDAMLITRVIAEAGQRVQTRLLLLRSSTLAIELNAVGAFAESDVRALGKALFRRARMTRSQGTFFSAPALSAESRR